MGVRLLVMFSIMVGELGVSIALILAVNSNYYGPMDNVGIAGVVMIATGILISWLLTIAAFMRKLPQAKVRRMVDDATQQAAKVLSDTTDKALALCSLTTGRCN